MTTARLNGSKSAGFHDVEHEASDLKSLCNIKQHHRAWTESKGPVTCPTCIARRALRDRAAASVAMTSALAVELVEPPLPVMPLIRGRVVARPERSMR